MTLPHEDVDPDGLLEYSVVFTDRSLNHMSGRFVSVMQDINRVLREAYDAHSVAIVPGGGSYAMESVARQLATGKKCLVVRNGLFSFRWSQILDAGSIASETTVLKASPSSDEHQSAWSPAPIAEVVSAIESERPAVVFAPHVETASGMLLPDDYVRQISDAVHSVGGVFVLDCIASGAVWASQTDLGVDVLISAPQKGWSGSPCAGYVMLSEAGRAAVQDSTSTSFAMDLKKWLFIADEYEEGRAPYHATMPTDSLAHNAAIMLETEQLGFDKLSAAQFELGDRVRKVFAERGLPSVATPEFASPSVVVVHTDNPKLATGAQFKEAGVQIAAGVPLQCDEPEDFSTFRIGLFGLDKLGDIDGTITRLETALDSIGVTPQS
ncbi:alanine--glyoxylate aminotransferase family protein [Brevibacterium aurantiacum]|uniref:Serine-pyruvate aminotransferase/archaeal aspartate aminotransferase n=2 Tax=Brevibacterium aurantiacum TaxID=273384 RepID=A0A1D7W6G7_BREAU|nr:alanine--glyoxylate aminotransferase family protein [Brevibacterium aurantiacum]MDN5549505.1 alanine--glyoxylate aminotransferase family protein [Brevibacterium sp.]AOP54636.1 Serine-pyruvate aminotransferase/archaeal aspartate aminotransferase [Brevibacterium aurantiacum]AZL10143.1 alanine--glyoxylate aminotransferase family protein [Brevibacterium aurantiacum]AZL13852.1 alanine--glyoxylate aminotransferase family protein [Brevibacterium aurantiacum]MDN5607803.1 alanine--glyoxylate aminotr